MEKTAIYRCIIDELVTAAYKAIKKMSITQDFNALKEYAEKPLSNNELIILQTCFSLNNIYKFGRMGRIILPVTRKMALLLDRYRIHSKKLDNEFWRVLFEIVLYDVDLKTFLERLQFMILLRFSYEDDWKLFRLYQVAYRYVDGPEFEIDEIDDFDVSADPEYTDGEYQSGSLIIVGWKKRISEVQEAIRNDRLPFTQAMMDEYYDLGFIWWFTDSLEMSANREQYDTLNDYAIIYKEEWV